MPHRQTWCATIRMCSRPWLGRGSKRASQAAALRRRRCRSRPRRRARRVPRPEPVPERRPRASRASSVPGRPGGQRQHRQEHGVEPGPPEPRRRPKSYSRNATAPSQVDHRPPSRGAGQQPSSRAAPAHRPAAVTSVVPRRSVHDRGSRSSPGITGQVMTRRDRGQRRGQPRPACWCHRPVSSAPRRPRCAVVRRQLLTGLRPVAVSLISASFAVPRRSAVAVSRRPWLLAVGRASVRSGRGATAVSRVYPGQSLLAPLLPPESGLRRRGAALDALRRPCSMPMAMINGRGMAAR